MAGCRFAHLEPRALDLVPYFHGRRTSTNLARPTLREDVSNLVRDAHLHHARHGSRFDDWHSVVCNWGRRPRRSSEHGAGLPQHRYLRGYRLWCLRPALPTLPRETNSTASALNPHLLTPADMGTKLARALLGAFVRRGFASLFRSLYTDSFRTDVDW